MTTPTAPVRTWNGSEWVLTHDLASAIPDSSVLHWPMGSGPGTTVTDDIGSNDGSFNGDPQWAADSNFVDGQKVTLDGTGDYISASNNGTAIDPASDFSVGITVDSGSSLSGEQFAWSWSDGSAAFGVYHLSGSFVAAYYDGSSYADYAAVSEPTAPYTVRLFLTYDSSAGSLEFFKNGSGTTSGGSGSLFILTSSLNVGAQQDGTDRYLNASVDDFITMSEIESATDDLNRQPWS